MVNAKSEKNAIRVSAKNTTSITNVSVETSNNSNPVTAANNKAYMYERQAYQHAESAKDYARQSKESAIDSANSAEQAQASADSILKNESFITVKENLNVITLVSNDMTNVNYVGENIEHINQLVEDLNNLGDTTNIEITASNINSINTIANNIEEVTTVSDHIDAIDIVTDNLNNIDYLAENMEDIQTVEENKNIVLSQVPVAVENANIAREQAEIATSQAVASTSSASVATQQASIATSKVTIATEQATIATNKAKESSDYSNLSKQWAISTTKVDNTDYSSKYYADQAKTSSTTATQQATTATNKANEAKTSASNALKSEQNALSYANSASSSATTATQQAQKATEEASKVSGKANNSEVVHLTGDETISGTKTFTGTIKGNLTGVASKATNDGSNNNIVNYYMPKLMSTQVVNKTAGNSNSIVYLQPYGRALSDSVISGINLLSISKDVFHRADLKGATVTCNYNDKIPNLSFLLLTNRNNNYDTSINPSVDFIEKPFVWEIKSSSQFEVSDVVNLHLYGHRGNTPVNCTKYKIEVYAANQWITVVDYEGEAVNIAQKAYGLFVSGYTSGTYYSILGLRLTISGSTDVQWRLAGIRLMASRGTESLADSIQAISNEGGTVYGNLTVKGTLDAKCSKDSSGNVITSTYATKTELNTKQNTLTAGENITIENNVISSTGGGGSAAIGSIVAINCAANYIPKGHLPCNGAEYSKSQFDSFYTYFLETNRLNTCTYEEYDQEISTYGQCGKFAVDTNNLTFKVPTIKDGAVIQQALSDSELGKAYNEGLPNITATLGGIFNSSGALAETSTRSNGSGDYDTQNANFNASRCSDVYGKTDETSLNKVQMNAIALRYFVIVADGEVNQAMFDWSQWATQLDLINSRPHIVEVSDKSLMPTWYRIYSDGWCEQGGIVTAGASNTGAQVLLAKELSESYSLRIYVLGESDTFNTAGTWVKSRAITNSSFYISSGYTGASSTAYTAYKCSWEAKGYLK